MQVMTRSNHRGRRFAVGGTLVSLALGPSCVGAGPKEPQCHGNAPRGPAPEQAGIADAAHKAQRACMFSLAGASVSYDEREDATFVCNKIECLAFDVSGIQRVHGKGDSAQVMRPAGGSLVEAPVSRGCGVDGRRRVVAGPALWAEWACGGAAAPGVVHCLWSDASSGYALAACNESGASPTHKVALLNLRQHQVLSTRAGTGQVQGRTTLVSMGKSFVAIQLSTQERDKQTHGGETLVSFGDLGSRQILHADDLAFSAAQVLFGTPSGRHVAVLPELVRALEFASFDDEVRSFRYHDDVIVLGSKQRFQAVGNFPREGPVKEFVHPVDERVRVVLQETSSKVCVGTMRWYSVDPKRGAVSVPLYPFAPRPSCVEKCARGPSPSVRNFP